MGVFIGNNPLIYKGKIIANLDEFALEFTPSLTSEFICEIPIIQSDSSEVNERDFIEIEVTNFDKEAKYIPNSDLVTYIYPVLDNKIRVYFGGVDEDTTINLAFRVYKEGFVSSPWSNSIEITIKDTPEESDDLIVNDDFSTYAEEYQDCEVFNDKVVFTADNGYYKEVITEQDEDETAWSSYQTSCNILLDKIPLFKDDTSNDVLATTNNDIENVSKCYITNDDYQSGIEIDIGDVTSENKDTSTTLDIFSDNSCISLLPFNDNIDDVGNTFELIAYDKDDNSVDTIYDTGKFDNAISLNADTNAYLMDSDCSLNMENFSISIWIDMQNNDSDDWNKIVYITKDGDAGTRINIVKSDNDGKKIFVQRYDNGSKVYSTDEDENGIIDISDEGFAHIVYTQDSSGNVKIYKNKELVFEKTYSAPDDVVRNKIEIGANDSGNFFVGLLDNFRMLDKALTDDEVEILYNENITIYKADISSNELESTLNNAYFIEPAVVVDVALSDDIVDDDFKTQTLESWNINTDTSVKINYYTKVSDYSGTKFQRKITANTNAVVTEMKTQMYKDS